MKIKIYAIAKKLYNCEDYVKMAQQFGTEMKLICINNAKIQVAQRQGAEVAMESYGESLLPFIESNALNIALSPNGKELDSLGFARILCDSSKSVNFFIGGAYGFAPNFLSKMQNISLSKLTFSHKIVPLILCEQIYRALCIINHHPYHK